VGKEPVTRDVTGRSDEAKWARARELKQCAVIQGGSIGLEGEEGYDEGQDMGWKQETTNLPSRL